MAERSQGVLSRGLGGNGPLTRPGPVDVPELENGHGGSFVTGLLNSIRSGFSLPGDVATGKIDPFSDEGARRAFDLAGTAMTGGIGGAGGGAVLGAGPVRRAASLPMDEVSRMTRAAEQGYTIDAFHGSTKKATAFRPDNRSGGERATFTTPDPEFANMFADGKEGQVYPVKVKTDGFVDFDNPAHVDAVARAVSARSGGRLTDEQARTNLLQRVEDGRLDWAYRDGVSAVKDAGFTGTRLTDAYDVPSFASFDPSTIRSRFAAFDPARAGEADLLAAGGSAPFGFGILSSPEPDLRLGPDGLPRTRDGRPAT